MLVAGLLVGVVTLTGCAPSSLPATHPVRGYVRFTDGQVLREGTIEFESLDYQELGLENPLTARAKIQPDGSFRLGTFTADDGAIQGKHQVVVIAHHLIGNGAERPGMIPTARLDPKYGSYRASPLTQVVVAGENSVVFEVSYEEPGEDASSDRNSEGGP